MNDTKISWTDVTWNPVFGCSKKSAGCAFCYAETIALKFKHSTLPWTGENARENVRLQRHKLHEPFKLKEPSRIFVNSMSDLFHPLVPDDYIAEVFEIMNSLPQHTFQVLTKRPERAARWAGPWGANIWMGTSVEDASVEGRIDALRECGAQTRFISAEPLIGPWERFDLRGIHWVIVGGESGFHMNRPEGRGRWMEHEWARQIRDACTAQDVAYFFKQSSGYKTELGTALEEYDGSAWEWHQYPHEFTQPTQVRGPQSEVAPE